MAEDEHRRKQEKPTTTPAEAATLARSLYNINAVTPLKFLDSYDDRNFYVPPTPTTAAYLLKVHNGVESDITDIYCCATISFDFGHRPSHEVLDPAT